MANSIASVIVPAGKYTLRYAESLRKDIKPEWMARFASPGGQVIKSNHPTFVYGHLSLYSSRIMGLIGKPEGITAKPEGWDALFKAGVECQDDPNGTIYPSHEAVMKHFFEGFPVALAAAESTDDSVYMKPNPAEGRFKEMAPTVGAAVSFIMGAHHATHLGQLSAWRRMMGLPAAN
ncbi:MAG: DinB family protein [Phycisphaerales bacterium]